MLHKKLSYDIIGCAMRAHTYLGKGYQEKVYQRALELEFQMAGIKYEREKSMEIIYRNGDSIGGRRVDFLVEEKIMVELKGVANLTDDDKMQTNNYCRIYNLPFGLLINFGAPSLQYHRIYNLEHPINIAWKKANKPGDTDRLNPK